MPWLVELAVAVEMFTTTVKIMSAMIAYTGYQIIGNIYT